jgi:hypothetical protein
MNAMPFQPVPATIKLSFFYTWAGQQCMNRIHVGVGATLPSEAECQSVATMGATWWLGNVQDLVPLNLSLRQVEAVSIAEQNGPQATFSSGLPAAGTFAQPSLPNNIAFCVSLRTGLTGRSARGRWYWAGLTEAQVVDNTVDTGTVTDIVAAIDNLLGAINALNADPILVSYNSGGGPRPGGPVKFIITDALAVDSFVDSQRRRLPGRGS